MRRNTLDKALHGKVKADLEINTFVHRLIAQIGDKRLYKKYSGLMKKRNTWTQIINGVRRGDKLIK